MKKIKNLIIKMDLVGNGVVNMDSNDQKWVFSGEEKSNFKTRHDNVSYAKKNFYRDSDGVLKHKLKISSDCMKHEMYKTDIINQSPNIAHHDALLYSYIASPMSITRGYMFANKSETIKRKGCLTLCDAEQTCNAESFIETFSRSGEKITNNGETEKADNSFYKKETIGNISYNTIGNIDLMALQFVSCDQVYDRYCFNPDKFPIYKQFLQSKLPNFNSELGYYKLVGSSFDISEFGFKLTNENVLFLVKQTLKKLLGLSINRKGGFAKASSIKIKLVENPLNDTFNNEENWIEIKTESDIDNLDFVVEDFYSLTDTEFAKQQRIDVESRIKALEAAEKQKSKDKKDKAKKDE
jgi:hypothetical protein